MTIEFLGGIILIIFGVLALTSQTFVDSLEKLWIGWYNIWGVKIKLTKKYRTTDSPIRAIFSVFSIALGLLLIMSST